jgi:hypothetical protein
MAPFTTPLFGKLSAATFSAANRSTCKRQLSPIIMAASTTLGDYEFAWYTKQYLNNYTSSLFGGIFSAVCFRIQQKGARTQEKYSAWIRRNPMSRLV